MTDSDAAGAGNGFTVLLLRHSQRKRGATDRLDLRNTAPVLDPTPLDPSKVREAPLTGNLRAKAYLDGAQRCTFERGDELGRPPEMGGSVRARLQGNRANKRRNAEAVDRSRPAWRAFFASRRS
jgi:hypothetical protein